MTEHHGRLFIGGAWREPSTDAVSSVVSPHSEQEIATAASAGPADVERAVTSARVAIDDGPWPREEPAARVDAVRRLVGLYAERSGDSSRSRRQVGYGSLSMSTS